MLHSAACRVKCVYYEVSFFTSLDICAFTDLDFSNFGLHPSQSLSMYTFLLVFLLSRNLLFNLLQASVHDFL